MHGTRVRLVFNRLQNADIKLNNKCEVSKHRITFLGHVISDRGVEADPEEAKAVREFPQPTNVKELQRYQWDGQPTGKHKRATPSIAEIG